MWFAVPLLLLLSACSILFEASPGGVVDGGRVNGDGTAIGEDGASNDACTIVTAPVCDVSELRCRGCTSTDECDAGTCNTLTGVCETN